MQMKFLYEHFNKILPWGLLIFFVIICSVLVYNAVDQAVTLDHRTQQCLIIQRQRDVLRLIADFAGKGITKAQLFSLLDKNGFDPFIKEKNNNAVEIVAEEVEFFLEDNRLVSITADDGNFPLQN